MSKGLKKTAAMFMCLIMTFLPGSDVWASGSDILYDGSFEEIPADTTAEEISESADMPEEAEPAVSKPLDFEEEDIYSPEKDVVYHNPQKHADGTVTYDCVWFGNYWQVDTNGNKKADDKDNKTPIKWRVLQAKGDDLFLLADAILDCVSYHNTDAYITWEKSTVRSWLNGYGSDDNDLSEDHSEDGFIFTAFTMAESQDIKFTNVKNGPDNGKFETSGGDNTNDRLFFLSYKESINPVYGFSYSDAIDDARTAKVTDFAYRPDGKGVTKRGKYETGAGNGNWWLRSPHDRTDCVLDVDFVGRINDTIYVGVNASSSHYQSGHRGIRPALHISPSSSHISPAGTVCSDGTVDEIAPPGSGTEDSGGGDESKSEVSTGPKTIVAGQKLYLKEACFNDVKEEIARYTVDDKKIASVNKKGQLKGKKPGKIKVTAQRKVAKKKYEDIASAEVEVLSKPKLKFAVPMTYIGQTLSANGMFTTPDTKTIGATYWESSNPGVVEVTDSDKGMLASKSYGSAKITAYFGEKGKKGTLKITSKISVKKPAFKKTDYTVKEGKNLTVSMKNVNGRSKAVWSVENGSIASVTEKTNSLGNPTGKVVISGIKQGDTRLKAVIDGQEYYCNIHVAAPK